MGKYKLDITLKSDICPGSGYAYSGLIDSDVCFDDLGIPYIPGRRLKGCLKESADMLKDNNYLENEVYQIFGQSGAKESGSILVGNAYIKGYDTLREELSAALMIEKNILEEEKKDTKEKSAPTLTPQSILDIFTSVKAQTKLNDDGVAMDDTLRYTRVVNQHCKTCATDAAEELTFTAEITLDENYFNDVENIVNATRNIGMDRTRGLGSVVCKIKTVDGSDTIKEQVFEGTWTGYEEDEDVVIRLLVNNTAPLMISGENDEVSLKYIPAQGVIGALAGKYLKDQEYSKEFEDLFLNGKTCFSNLYVAKQGTNDEYILAPSFINKLKKTGKYVNILEIENKDGYTDDELLKKNIHPQFADIERKQSGNMPKKLRGKFIALETDSSGGNLFVKDLSETDMAVEYHHSKKAGKEGDEPILYTNEVIKEGQTFTGSILTKGKYVSIIKKLLESGPLRFGKSKSAQYGSCRLLKAEVKKTGENKQENNSLKSGDIVYVSLVSDGIFMNDKDYTVRYDEVRDIVAEAIKLKDNYENDDEVFSFVSTGIAFGYNTKWNLRKQPVPVIAAGSTFVYKINKDCEITEAPVGERVHEGFGRIKIFKNARYDMNTESREYAGDQQINKPDKDSLAAEMIRSIFSEAVLKALPEPAHMGDGIDNTQLGRLTLMLKQSKNDAKNLCERVDNIKSDGVRTDFYNWLRSTGLFRISSGELELTEENNKFDFGAAERIFDIYEKIVDDRDFKKNFLKDHKYEILMTHLTNEKYYKKINDKSKSLEDKGNTDEKAVNDDE